MFILSKDRILDELEAPTPRLHIAGRALECLQHTFYYFRLGDRYEVQNEAGSWVPGQRAIGGGIPLVLKAGRCMRVQTMESFGLGATVLGAIGSHTELALMGVSLLHGPYIDPLFPALDEEGNGSTEVVKPLSLMLRNETAHSVHLNLGQRIGKVSFFDISDAYPIKLPQDSLFAQAVDRLPSMLPVRQD
ncbi:hypothetical protein ACVU7I_06595 [Patulibacter sp. S7RM1-6]